MYKVYKITNTINNKIYSGCTKRTLYARLHGHWRQRKLKTLIGRAIILYGLENFKIELLKEYNTKEEMFLSEIAFIAAFKSNNNDIGYNLTDGGDSGPSLVGSKNGMFGKKRPDLVALNKARIGVKLTHEHRAKIRTAIKNPVICIENNTEYPTIMEASRMLNIDNTSINHVLSGRYKTAGGYSFKRATKV